MMPNSAMAAISRLVAIGRRMKCSEMFTAMVDGPKCLYGTTALFSVPNLGVHFAGRRSKHTSGRRVTKWCFRLSGESGRAGGNYAGIRGRYLVVCGKQNSEYALDCGAANAGKRRLSAGACRD